MIELIGAIGWETHLVFQSKIPGGLSIAKIHSYMDCVQQGCKAIHQTVERAALLAKDAEENLPGLKGASGKKLEARLVSWRSRLE